MKRTLSRFLTICLLLTLLLLPGRAYAAGASFSGTSSLRAGDKVKFVERPRKHRYIFFNADRRRKRELLKKLRYPILPYPKGEGVANTVDVEVPDVLVPTQLSLFDL